ncbi:hypothetical protein FO519_005435 [Halicephalobus sp. NKZ332]|nr:hypothetical protein FO519_005435 [Halicephalobus sp. NKZ332]
MRFLPITTVAIRIIAFALSVGTVNGYILGRLMTLRSIASPGGAENPEVSNVALVAPFNFDASQEETPSFTLEKQKKAFEFPKKSTGALKKYAGSGSRNCFFTPIQCMIQHDMSKYKKLVDSNIQIGRISRRDFLSP